MVVIADPSIEVEDLIRGQQEESERRKKARAQELMTESLIRQESINETKSMHQAKLYQSTLKSNRVFKAGDDIENIWTFKNAGKHVIPEGTKFVMVAGDEAFNV